MDVKAREVDAHSHFPQLKASGQKLSKESNRAASFKRPLPPGSLDNMARKKTKRQMPSFPSKHGFAWRAGQSSNTGQSSSAGQGDFRGARQETYSSSQPNRGKHSKVASSKQPLVKPNASHGKKLLASSPSKPSKNAKQQSQYRN